MDIKFKSVFVSIPLIFIEKRWRVYKTTSNTTYVRVFGQSINKHVRSNTEGQHAKWVNVQKLSGMISFTEAAGTSAW